ncbi:polycystin-1-like protein 2 [Saccostrea echinata]|uniref:polycystin-1-like protein 2 n=1 Tax=Saccostrea echinata TaxID=191078 RepID=UPI002A7EB948|nr:polycystin-1-like protein 2 [Saccostrea echinata]
MLPEKLQDLNEELSEEAIKGDIIIGIKRFLQETDLLQKDQGNITLDYSEINRRAHMLYRIRSHHRQLQILQRDTAKKFIPIIKEILRVFVTVLQKTIVVGERISFDGLGVLDIMIRKLSSKDFVDAPDKFFVNLNNVNGSKNQDPYYEIAVLNFMKNPYIYGENASEVTSSVPVMEFPPNITVDSKVPNEGKLEFKKYIPLINPQYSEQMIYFTFDIINYGDAAIIYFKPDGFDFSSQMTTQLYSFYFSTVTFPTSIVFNYKKVLGVRDWTRFGFKVFLKEGVCGKGICYLGIKPLAASRIEHISRSRKRRAAETFTTTSEAPGNASAIANTTIEANTTIVANVSEFIPYGANFSIIFLTTGCRTWDNENNSWTTEGCQVLPMSDLNNTVCRCVGDTFSSSFYVPPNVINFLTVWGKFDASNAAVYGTLIAVFLVYIILLIVLRKQDKRDTDKWAVNFLSDHSAEHVYFYMISVYTGIRRGGGTRSNIYFILTGDYGDSGIRALNSNNNEGFSAASVRMFLFGTNESIGDIKYVRVWHDNSGPNGTQSWFLSKIIIDDLQTKERYSFNCNKWLAVDDGDCMLDRILPVSTPNVTSLKSRFSDETQTQLYEHHLWLSLLIRPKQSNFTRVQRLTCLLALMCLIMISNAMFFKASKENQNLDQIEFGVFRFSFTALYVSCMGIIISTPPVIFAAFVFRHTNGTKSRKHGEINSSNINKKGHCQQTNDFSIDGKVFNSKKRMFPRWVYFVAWVLVLLAIVSSCFFLILYSMEWGKAISEEWLSSFVISFLESLFVVDPVKVIFIAIIMSTILKNLMQEDRPNLDLQKLRSVAGEMNICRETRFSDLTSEVLPTCDLYSKEELYSLREKCREESKARSALTNLILFIVYIIAIYGISFMQRDSRSFSMKQNLDSFLLSGSRGFANIKGHKDFLSWMNDIFIPTFYPNESYAGTALSVIDRQWLKDMRSIRVGPARLRQVRMKTGKCPYSSLPWSYPCIDAYSETDEDQSLYCLQWRPYNDTVCGKESYRSRFYTAEAWAYTDASKIWGFSRAGEYSTYSGGGYILKFVKNRVNAHLLLDELVQYKWISRHTRAIFLEFTTYNPNVNLFVYAMFLVEFPEVGGAFTWTDTQAFKPVLNLASLHFSIVVFYIVFMLYYIYLLLKMIWRFKELGCLTVIKEPWNCLECFCICIAYACMVIFVFRMKSTKTAMDMFYEDKLTGANRFINYGHIVMCDNAFNILFSTLVFVSTIQILKILGYNKRFVEVISVMANAGKDLIAFGVLLLVSFVAFVLYGYLVFGSKLEHYRSIYDTCGSLANTFIGKNRLDPLVGAAPLAAQFFYMTYAVFVIMFMVTIFMSILNSSISLVRAETAVTSSKIGMVDIVKKQFESILHFFYSPKKQNINEKTQNLHISEDINAVNVMGLIRDIVTVYGSRGTKLVERKYYEDNKFLISKDTASTDKSVENQPNDEMLIQKPSSEEQQRLPVFKTDLKDSGRRMSESSELSESSVDLLIDFHDKHNNRSNTFSRMF